MTRPKPDWVRENSLPLLPGIAPEQKLAAAVIKDAFATIKGVNWPGGWNEQKRRRHMDEARRWLECPRFREVWLAAVTPAGQEERVQQMVAERVSA